MIKDSRVTPSPPDFPVIRAPGNFYGWTFTIELANGPVSIPIFRTDTPQSLAGRLEQLANELKKL